MSRLIDADKWIEDLKKKLSHPNYHPDLGDAFQCMEIEQRNEEIASVIMDIQKQPTAEPNPWIPCSERMPERDNPVLATAIYKYTERVLILKASYVAQHTSTTEDYGWKEYEGDTEYDEENDCFWIPECWYEDNAVDDNGNWILDGDYQIIAWMPLPEPYKESEVSE